MKFLMAILFSLTAISSVFADTPISVLKEDNITITVIDKVDSDRYGPNLKSCFLVLPSLPQGRSYGPKNYKVGDFKIVKDERSPNTVRLTVIDSKARPAFVLWCYYVQDSFDDLNSLLSEIGLKANLYY